MMRVHSLIEFDNDPEPLHAAVCIIGAGAAGLYLAHRLGAAGHQVVVLEAGPKTPVAPGAAGFECTFQSETYRGATDGRAFGLGGTTALWGGQLIPFPSGDGIRQQPLLSDVWRHILRVIANYQHKVAVCVGAQPDLSSRLAFPAPLPGDLLAIASQWLPFRRRNFAWLASSNTSKSGTVDVYCDAVATQWGVGGGPGDLARILEVVARSASGKHLSVRADRFVIAAGAIESTRILHEINMAGAQSVIRSGAALGHYLSDHLSVRIADTGKQARRRIVNSCGPRFDAGLMHSWRFIEAHPAPDSPRYFAHLIFPSEDNGFLLARTVLQALQARKVPSIGARNLGAGAAGLARLAWFRWARSRLYVPVTSASHLQLDMEQRASFSNQVRLRSTTDSYGRPVACVDWKVSEADRADLACAKSAFLSHWSAVDDTLTDTYYGDDTNLSLKPHNAFHPVGTCRMGTDMEAVVGYDLGVHGVSNLNVVSTAVFPSCGSANPTFSLLCLAEMLADNIMSPRGAQGTYTAQTSSPGRSS